MDLKKKKGDYTRQHIISVATLLFLDKGYYATSIKDIITASEISKGAFYHHFSSKLELYKTIINDFLDVDDRLITSEEVNDLRFDETLKFVISKYYEYIRLLTEQTGKSILHFQRMYFEAMLILPEVHEKMKRTYLKYINLFTEKLMNEQNITYEKAIKIIKRQVLLYEGVFYWISIFPETQISELLELAEMDTASSN